MPSVTQRDLHASQKLAKRVAAAKRIALHGHVRANCTYMARRVCALVIRPLLWSLRPPTNLAVTLRCAVITWVQLSSLVLTLAACYRPISCLHYAVKAGFNTAPRLPFRQHRNDLISDRRFTVLYSCRMSYTIVQDIRQLYITTLSLGKYTSS